MNDNWNIELTSPKVRIEDPVFPGESWFLYWKTASSLWESKITQFAKGTKLYVPLNWSFHTETGDSIDFGNSKPETNLARLVEIAEEKSVEIFFMLPIGPIPFAVNGGIPSILARELAINSNGLAQVCRGSSGKLIKYYTYFDTSVYHAFSKFVIQLSRYFSSNNISNDLWIVESGELENNNFVSHFLDYGPGFDRSFSKFLEVKKYESSKDLNKNGSFSGLKKSELRLEFEKTIKELYVNTIKETFNDQYGGFLKVNFLGTSSNEIFQRHAGEINSSKSLELIFESVCNRFFPSGAILTLNPQEDLVSKVLSELESYQYFNNLTSQGLIESEDEGFFVPHYFFKLFSVASTFSEIWSQSGLIDCIKEKYNWSFRLLQYSEIFIDEIEEIDSKISFFDSENFEPSDLHMVLKKFLNGAKCILDTSFISSALNKRIETFILENDLNCEEINLGTHIRSVQLGQGHLILLNCKHISSLEGATRKKLWNKIFSVFDFFDLEISHSGDVQWLWWTRTPNTNELQFEEIRRVSLYNPTSYKKKVTISVNKNFVPLKLVNVSKAKTSTAHSEVSVELLPGGSLSVDFGLIGDDE